jgi:Asp-tRNA(Asn)/Glu-tRNA(Gln) amidotransferase A subunit family amidase
MSTPLTHCSATEIARLIRERAVSGTEVMDAHLAAIERLNPQLNAIVTVAERAREQAVEQDQALARW